MADTNLPHSQSNATSSPLLGDHGGPPRPEESLTLMTWPVPGAMVLSLGGELDLSTVPRLTERVRTLVEQGYVRIVLDLAHLEFCDCSGLRALIRVQRIATEAGGWVRLSRVGGLTRHIIALTGLREVLVCYDGSAAAVEAR